MTQSRVETAIGDSKFSAQARLEVAERGTWHFDWLCEKWSEDVVQFIRRKLELPALADVPSALIRELLIEPYEVVEVKGNLLVNEGINQIEDALIGAGSLTAFNNANSRMGVGDSSTAATASQTDLQAATNKTYKAMNATFPSRAAQTVTWQSDFQTGDANYAWQEFIIDNGSTASVTLNRKVSSLGTKTVGIWTLTGTLVIA